MRVLFIIFAFILFAGGVTAVETQSSQRVDIKIDHERSVRRTGLKIKFIDMVEDSRCPKDVECIWAGNAKIKVRISKNGRSKILELNSNTKSSEDAFAGYKFALVGLTPEPHSNIRINRKGYVAAISIDRVK